MTSYYSPSVPGTVNITYGAPATPPVYWGENHNMIVACDLARTIYAFCDGAIVWQKAFPNSWPRGLAMFEGILFFADGATLVLANPKTGHEHARYPMGAQISGISVIKQTSGEVFVTLAFEGSGSGKVRVYRLSNLQLSQISSCSHSVNNPRSAYACFGWVFVADTFGHRVFAYDLASGAMRNSTPVYYPNMVEPVAADRVRICAEHENRIFVWDYHPSDTREMEMCAPVLPYCDITATRDQIITGESGTAAPGYTPPKSACAAEYAGDLTLYSPNSATMTPHGLLIADTDNHRVILVRGGQIVAKIEGFNNPTNAVLF